MTSKVINLCPEREMCCMCFLLKFRFEGYSKQSTIKNMFDLNVQHIREKGITTLRIYQY